MTRLLSLVAFALLTGSLIAMADPPSKLAWLVDDLGSESFQEREAAEKALEALGEPAIGPLKSACKSSNPEISKRAQDVLTRIERKLDNEKMLAPTMVNLEARLATLNDIMNDLSRQSGIRIVLGNPAALDEPPPVEIGLDRFSLKTGRVPFWKAIVILCDVAQLEIQSVAGFFGPGVRLNPLPPIPVPTPTIMQPTFLPKLPPAMTKPATQVSLVPRGFAKKRPYSVQGAVLVEGFELPKTVAVKGSVSAVLQVWPEPKLQWQSTQVASIYTAIDDQGVSLAPLYLAPDASRAIVPNFAIHNRQTVVNLKPSIGPSKVLKEFKGSVMGRVRVENELLVGITGMKTGIAYEGSHRTGSILKASFSKSPSGEWQAEVELRCDDSIQTNNAISNLGFETLYGMRVNDAAGIPFTMAPSRIPPLPVPKKIGSHYTLPLRPTKEACGDPASISFSGSYDKPVEVSFELKDIPLAGGLK